MCSVYLTANATLCAAACDAFAFSFNIGLNGRAVHPGPGAINHTERVSLAVLCETGCVCALLSCTPVGPRGPVSRSRRLHGSADQSRKGAGVY